MPLYNFPTLSPWAESLRQDAEDARLLGKEAEERERFIVEREWDEGEIIRPERDLIISVLQQ